MRPAASAALAVAALAMTAGQGQAAERAGGASTAAQAAACSTATTKVTVQNVSRPVNHQLLTLTNTGRTACYAYSHPYLRFDEAHSVTGVVEDSKPQSVVTLAPGESAYAGIGLSAADSSGDNGRTARTLTVFLDNGSGPAGTSAKVTLPKGTWIDDSAFVTYWQADPNDAISW
ncbi:DUF4232 domain-containing protein [Streptomyces sp. I05A-00742]|uniref:DUF4232 domain-containing protein n=1 Tax=Streptomyces sp. I05A-00742 TaxID=2732853 RepID=UPI002017724B|nr:DUF4232 domain-containing protein [Streptomyces sp. I05A-00742]